MLQEPIRVLNLFTVMNRGGAETMVMNYYRKMDRNKVQFDFLVHRQERGAYDDEIESLGGKIYRTMPLYPKNFRNYKKWAKEFLAIHPEYKIVHSHMSESGYFFFKEAKKKGVPILICHAHNAPVGWDIKMFVRTYFKYRIRRYCTYMFACGKDAGQWLFGQKNSAKIILQNNAIDAKLFRYNTQKREEVRRALGVQDKFVVGHIGRFSEQKNHTFLIDIFNELQNKLDNSVLVLVGEGGLEESIKNKVEHLGLSDKVMFLGLRDDVSDLLQGFDLFLFPSLFEGLSVALVEAQATGIPCLISNNIPSECVITDCIFVEDLKSSVAKWAETIKTISNSFERKDQLEDIVKAGFDITSNAKWLERFYLEAYEKC